MKDDLRYIIMENLAYTIVGMGLAAGILLILFLEGSFWKCIETEPCVHPKCQCTCECSEKISAEKGNKSDNYKIGLRNEY